MADVPTFGGLEIRLAISSGIPEAYTATMQYAIKVRETMEPDLRRRIDELNTWLAERFWSLFGYQPKGG